MGVSNWLLCFVISSPIFGALWAQDVWAADVRPAINLAPENFKGALLSVQTRSDGNRWCEYQSQIPSGRSLFEICNDIALTNLQTGSWGYAGRGSTQIQGPPAPGRDDRGQTLLPRDAGGGAQKSVFDGGIKIIETQVGGFAGNVKVIRSLPGVCVQGDHGCNSQ